MTANKINVGAVFEAQKNGEVRVMNGPLVVVSHLDTIRLAYWLVKQYAKAAAKRS